MELYVVTRRGDLDGSAVGIFSDKSYVYSKFDTIKYKISPLTIDHSKFEKPNSEKLKELGRSDFVYKYIKPKHIKRVGLCETKFEYDGKEYKTYNEIDPYEGEFTIEFEYDRKSMRGVEQEHNVENFSLLADLLSDFFKLDKNNIIIFHDENGQIFLGSTEYFDLTDREFGRYLRREKKINVLGSVVTKSGNVYYVEPYQMNFL